MSVLVLPKETTKILTRVAAREAAVDTSLTVTTDFSAGASRLAKQAAAGVDEFTSDDRVI